MVHAITVSILVLIKARTGTGVLQSYQGFVQQPRLCVLSHRGCAGKEGFGWVVGEPPVAVDGRPNADTEVTRHASRPMFD